MIADFLREVENAMERDEFDTHPVNSCLHSVGLMQMGSLPALKGVSEVCSLLSMAEEKHSYCH